jgi:hypothetical protein
MKRASCKAAAEAWSLGGNYAALTAGGCIHDSIFATHFYPLPCHLVPVTPYLLSRCDSNRCIFISSIFFIQRHKLMNEPELADAIVTACTDDDGVLIQLRTTNALGQADYDSLIDLLRRYESVLGTTRMMDRRVAGCLHELEQQLLIQIEQRQREPYPTPTKQLLDHAFREITDLITAIFWK